MYKLILFIFLFSQSVFAQFKFKGIVSESYYGGRAYLSLIKDCNKADLFITEDILQDCNISGNGEFEFSGDFLEEDNRIYKIHIDHCNEPISDYKHLINHCAYSREVVFIANNKDQIYFPVNPLSQILCDLEQSSNVNSSALIKLQDYEEVLLTKLQFSKNDFQRQNIYKSYFKNIQKYSETFKEPLVELYAYYMYAKDNSISAEAYIQDLKINNTYYDLLLEKLQKKYPNSHYTVLYNNKLQKDKYPYIKSKQTIFETLTYVLVGLLIIALIIIYKLNGKRNEVKVESVIDYRKSLTAQEQKVFELMLSHSNKEIAAELFISISTVKTHINNIYNKLSISSRKDIEKFM